MSTRRPNLVHCHPYLWISADAARSASPPSATLAFASTYGPFSSPRKLQGATSTFDVDRILATFPESENVPTTRSPSLWANHTGVGTAVPSDRNDAMLRNRSPSKSSNVIVGSVRRRLSSAGIRHADTLPPMPSPFEIADRFVDAYLRLSPMEATALGVREHDDRWNDLSPDGFAAGNDLAIRTETELAPTLDHPDPAQRLAARVLHADQASWRARYDAGEHQYQLGHIATPLQDMRRTFDLMEMDEVGFGAVIRRLETLGGFFSGYLSLLREGIAAGRTVSVRQARAAIEQARSLAGDGSAFRALVGRAERAGHHARRERLVAAIDRGRMAAAEFADSLETDYLPHAVPRDAVGPARYALAVDKFLGMDLDPEEAYSWGWEEIDRLLGEATRVSGEIRRGATIGEIAELLETDPARAVHSVERFLEFVRERQEQAVERLDGVHFEVPRQGRTVGVFVAPPGGPLGAYYLPPSEDHSRPGGIWYSVGDQTTFPLYQEVSTAYHEGFPGHHLQFVVVMSRRDELSRAHRQLLWHSGYGEGWALYAERLMDELGFFEQPEHRFGMLASHLFRAARVVVDLGLHLGFPIPVSARSDGRERWDFDGAVEFMQRIGMQTEATARSEVLRYLGWPGQAISYKIGEREILAIRDEVRRREGAAFDLASFHRRVLGGGSLRLAMLRDRLLVSDQP